MRLDDRTEALINAFGMSIQRYAEVDELNTDEEIAELWGATSDTRQELRNRIRVLIQDAVLTERRRILAGLQAMDAQ